MSIGRVFVILGLIGVLAVLWWGLSVDPAPHSPKGDPDDPARGRRSPPAAPSAGAPDPSARGVIFGGVTEGGKPVPATVELRLRRNDGRPDARSRVDRLLTRVGLIGREAPRDPQAVRRATADGRFRFEDLAPGRYEVRARTGDGRVSAAFLDLRPPAACAALGMEIPEGDFTLAGRIVWADGRPFSGEVWIGSESGPTRARPTRTDAEGRFRIPHVGHGWFPLTVATGSSLVSSVGPVRVPTARELLIRVGDGEQTCGGRVLDDKTGRPVAGAHVVLFSWNCGAAATRTDETGAFRLTFPSASSRKLGVFSEGYSPVEIDSHRSRRDLTIRILRAAAIHGTVVDAKTRSPVPGVRVFARSPGFARLHPPTETQTDREGRYRMAGLPAGPVAVLAAGEGWISAGAADGGTGVDNPLVVDLKPGGEVLVDLVAVPAAAVSGRVVSAAGAGEGGILVSTVLRTWSEAGWFEPVTPRTITAADGTFRLIGLVPHGEYSLEATDGRHRSARLDRFLVPADGLDGIELRLPELERIEVLVTDAGTGRPIEGVWVTIRETADHGWFRGIQQITGVDGRARFEAERGRYARARAAHDDYRRVSEFAPLDREGRANLVLEKGGVVEGVARLPDGTPAVGGEIRWEEQLRTGGTTSTWRRKAPIGERGEFRAAGLPGKEVKIVAECVAGGREYLGVTWSLPGTKDAVIRLEAREPIERGTGRVTVVVLDPEGRPVPFGFVRGHRRNSWNDDMSTRGGRLGAAGANLISGRALISGPWKNLQSVEVMRPLDPARRPLPYAAQRVTELPSEGGELVVRLTRGRSVSGRVVGTSGEGLRGVNVCAYAPGPPHGSRHAVTGTDGEGNFRLLGLMEGAYWIVAAAPPGYAPPDPVKAAAGERGIVVRLPRGRAADLTLLDAEGRPVARAEIEVLTHPGAGRIARWETGANGRARIDRLPKAGEFLLVVNAPRGREDLLDRRIASWGGDSCTVTLARAYAIRGRVVTAAGTGLSGCSVTLRSDEGKETGHFADSEGDFRFDRLPAGRYRLRARGGGLGEAPESEEVVVAAGATDVRIVFSPGPHLTVRVLGDVENLEDVTARLVRTEKKERGDSLWEGLDESGRVTFRGLLAGAGYTVWIGPTEKGECFYREGIRPTEEELTVRLSPGLSVSGRVILPPGASGVSLRLMRSGLDVDDPEADETGRFEVGGLPPGSYTIEAYAEVEDAAWFARSTVKAGGSIVLELALITEDDE